MNILQQDLEELNQWHESLWITHFDHMERNHPAYETCAAIERVTGYKATAFDMLSPDFSWDVVHDHIRAGWRRLS